MDFQWATLLAVEQGQRWRCASYSPRSTLVVPYASTQSLATIRLRPSAEKKTLLFFRCARQRGWAPYRTPLRQCGDVRCLACTLPLFLR